MRCGASVIDAQGARKEIRMVNVNKDRPSPEWLASLRKRYPTEREIDRILTRRIERRAGPGYTPLPLQTLIEGTRALIRSQHRGAFEILDPRWLSGGASKLQMAFTLEWERPGVGNERTPMVLRMEPAESIVETSRLREFQLLRAFEGVIPVPTTFWCDVDAEFLPYPALIYGFSAGVTKPSTASSGVTGLGTQLTPAVRAQLAPQFVQHLVAIHRHDFTKSELTAFDMPAPGTTQCAEWGINWWDRVWEEDCDEEVPLMR